LWFDFLKSTLFTTMLIARRDWGAIGVMKRAGRFTDPAIWCIFPFVKRFSGMGEFLDPATAEFPLQLVLGIACSVGLAVYALLQPGEGSDDDDHGSGGGGLMQPVATGAS
jgi:hypothetical protein